MIEDFKRKLNRTYPPSPRRDVSGQGNRSQKSNILTKIRRNTEESTTPPGSPPQNVIALANNIHSAPRTVQALPASIAETLATLKNIAQQQSSVGSQATISASVPVSVPGAVPALAPALVSAPPSVTHSTTGIPSNNTGSSFMNAQPSLSLPFAQASQSAAPASISAALPFFPLPQVPGLPNFTAQNGAASSVNGIIGVPPSAPAPGSDPTALQVALIGQLIQKGLPADQIAAIVKALASNNAAAPAAVPQAAQPSQGAYPIPISGSSSNNWRPDDRDMRSPNNRPRGRSRSRSPGRHWEQRESPRGRDDRRFGDFGGGRNSPARDRFDDRNRDRGRQYRQRSPSGRRGSSPRRVEMPPFQQEKLVQTDPTLPSGHIKVLSRTLFVGGVTCPESELRNMFSRFAAVQTCIVNKEKRHAFVKMYTRKDAVCAKEAMEEGRSPDAQLRTRWGVGFGPRDCSDYQTGISVIPIHKLTDADRKWMLTAPYGGSGGKPITAGMVVEEPDIEIGAGVSSKAISRRMQTDKGGSHGPKSTHHRDNDHHERNERRHGRRGGGGRDHGPGRRDDKNPNNEPVVPPFGFGISTDQRGMPVFPPGFSFPAPDAINNPPY